MYISTLILTYRVLRIRMCLVSHCDAYFICFLLPFVASFIFLLFTTFVSIYIKIINKLCACVIVKKVIGGSECPGINLERKKHHVLLGKRM